MTKIVDLLDEHKRICTQANSLVQQRGNEYATEEDTLKTFREVGKELGMHPSTIALMLLSIKYKRLIEQAKKHSNFDDSILDLINYAIYFKVLRQSEEVD